MTPTFKLAPGGYFGGKGAAGAVHQLINQVPIHDTFVSMCLGRCTLLRTILPCKRQVGLDLDPAVIALWREADSAKGVKVELHQENALNWNDHCLYRPETFVYWDPPYTMTERTSGKRYRHEWATDHHVRMIDVAKFCTCMVMISCYDNDVYRNGLKGWRRVQYQAQTRGGVRTETIYMNYEQPRPDQLHDVRFLGANFRKREKTKRRLTTIIGKTDRLEPEEKEQLIVHLRAQLAAIPPKTRPALIRSLTA